MPNKLSLAKGLKTLFKAFSLFRKSCGRGRLVLVGAGPAYAELLAYADELKLSAFIEFAGAMNLDGLASQYARALCLVLPSTSEPWGLVVNEALHYGCPAIVSESCGCRPELIVDGVTGFAFRAGDHRELSTRMAEACTAFADVALVAKNCQATIATFSPEHAADQIRRGCERVLQMVR
jgi:glycosyltransferase involved in cell wall biosynthesis